MKTFVDFSHYWLFAWLTTNTKCNNQKVYKLWCKSVNFCFDLLQLSPMRFLNEKMSPSQSLFIFKVFQFLNASKLIQVCPHIGQNFCAHLGFMNPLQPKSSKNKIKYLEKSINKLKIHDYPSNEGPSKGPPTWLAKVSSSNEGSLVKPTNTLQYSWFGMDEVVLFTPKVFDSSPNFNWQQQRIFFLNINLFLEERFSN